MVSCHKRVEEGVVTRHSRNGRVIGMVRKNASRALQVPRVHEASGLVLQVCLGSEEGMDAATIQRTNERTIQRTLVSRKNYAMLQSTRVSHKRRTYTRPQSALNENEAACRRPVLSLGKKHGGFRSRNYGPSARDCYCDGYGCSWCFRCDICFVRQHPDIHHLASTEKWGER